MPFAALALLLSTSLAQAGVDASLPAPPAPPSTEGEHADAPTGDRLPAFGLAVDAGAPEGLVLSGVWRPAPYVRLYAGPGWNYLGFGLQGGATLVPWAWAVSPAVSVEAGHYFSSDLTWLATNAGGVPAGVEPLLRHVGYSYASLLLGVELGNPRGLSFSVRAGLSYLWLVARGTATTNASGGVPSATDARVELTDPRLKATVPSVKVGLQYWF